MVDAGVRFTPVAIVKPIDCEVRSSSSLQVSRLLFRALFCLTISVCFVCVAHCPPFAHLHYLHWSVLCTLLSADDLGICWLNWVGSIGSMVRLLAQEIQHTLTDLRAGTNYTLRVDIGGASVWPPLPL